MRMTRRRMNSAGASPRAAAYMMKPLMTKKMSTPVVRFQPTIGSNSQGRGLRA
ncbi:hypothetical protein LRS10_10820 [Phenylobacterium sp. J426]|nr:hypothetical protein [Phenylobacterium sp. J426]MCR5874616.1 hypothetical protein [Phenylobacterium sp. J426]